MGIHIIHPITRQLISHLVQEFTASIPLPRASTH